MGTRNPNTLHPNTYEKYIAHMNEMRAAGLNPRGVAFWRSEEEQLEMVAKKLSRIRYGFHNLTYEGYPCSYAYDIALLNERNTEVLEDDHPHWEMAAKIGEDCGMYSGGLNWGWDWGHFQDSVGITLDEARFGKAPVTYADMVSDKGSHT